MPTRSVTHFIDAERKQFDPATGLHPLKETFHIFATIYKHEDGYPDSMVPRFEEFLNRVGTLKGHRFGDSSYLAARWVVFLSEMYAMTYDPTKGGYVPADDPLDFTWGGVVNTEPADIDYRYYVDCTEREVGVPPRVGYQATEWDDEELCLVPGATRFDEITWVDFDARLLHGEEAEH